MTRTWLAATAAFTLVAGVAMAETTSTTTTETIAPSPPPLPKPSVTRTVVQRTVDDNGVVHTRTVTTTAPVTAPDTDAAPSKKTTETMTTVR